MSITLFTSYFYQVRFFRPYQIPISTALTDPKWFHDWKELTHYFVDKRGVINGLRAESLHPGQECKGLCHGYPCSYHPNTCGFLEAYSKQINHLDVELIQNKLRKLGQRVKEQLRFSEEPEFILLVHEAPTNPCSERGVLQHAFDCSEWENNKKKK